MSPAGELAAKLRGRKDGQQWKARCPAHKDADPSLGIRDGRDGAILVHCHAGCSQEAVLDALRRLGMWPDRANGHAAIPPRPPQQRASPRAESTDAKWTPIFPVPSTAPKCDIAAILQAEAADFWDYVDIEGRLLGYVARVNDPRGKKILPITFCAGPSNAREWRMVGFPSPRPLYGLRCLAQKPNAPALVVEGEKAACAGAEIFDDFVVITWPGGVQSVDKADWNSLAGRSVTLWPDADPQGIAAMSSLATILDRVGVASVRMVSLPPELPKGWDLADRVPVGLDLRALLDAAPDMRKAKVAGLGLVSAADLMAREFKEPKWAVPQLIAEGLAILAGKPKTGKSWAALDFAVAVAGGYGAFGNIECKQGDVLLLALEDNDRRLQQRLKAVLQGKSAPAALQYATSWRRADSGGLDDLAIWLSAHPNARLVVIDTLQMIRGQRSKSEGVYADDYKAVGDLKALADKHGVPFLVVHHLRKESTGDPLESVSGTAGITGSADTILVLKREPKDCFGVLYVRGRDVPEAEMPLQFDEATGKWLRLVGPDDFRRSKERNAILRVLLDVGEAMSPTEIADAIGKPGRSGSVRVLLHKMRKAGDVVKRADGKYATGSLP